MTTFNSVYRAITKSPIAWGLLGAAAFYGLVFGGPLDIPFIRQYFTHHPIEYAEAVMFAIGLSALLLRLIDVAGQGLASHKSLLGPASNTERPIEENCQAMLGQLDQLPEHRRDEYFPRRLRSVIHYVERLGSTQGLDDELKYLADMDATRLHNAYGLFRVIIWAIPILGFLGTVIGITMALNGLDPKALDESMLRVMTGLGMKFDTTALALAMSMLLMFTHFFVDRAENSLLESVDERVEIELANWFPRVPAGPDGQAVAVRRMAETMVLAAEKLVQRQAELWQASMQAAETRWAGMAAASAEQLTRVMAAALAESLKGHAQQLSANEQVAAEQNRRQWDKLAQSQTQTVQAIATLQTGMTRQAEVLSRAIEASGEVGKLQDALNRNLASLAGAKHFQQTVESLAATIHLLNAQLTDSASGTPSIQLETNRRTAHAA